MVDALFYNFAPGEVARHIPKVWRKGRPMYAALRAIPIPDDVVARFFHAASLLREHRGDGDIAALMIEGVGGLEPFAALLLAAQDW